MTDASKEIAPKKIPWNKARFTGAKPPLKPKQIWGIRAWLQMAKQSRDLALFDLAIDSKLRGCDLVRLKISDIALHGSVQNRATVVQRKTGRPVQFELTEQTRASVHAWLQVIGDRCPDYLFPSRVDRSGHVSTRQNWSTLDFFESNSGHKVTVRSNARTVPGAGQWPQSDFAVDKTPECSLSALLRSSRAASHGVIVPAPCWPSFCSSAGRHGTN